MFSWCNEGWGAEAFDLGAMKMSFNFFSCMEFASAVCSCHSAFVQCAFELQRVEICHFGAMLEQ